jgi:hypothetical protein
VVGSSGRNNPLAGNLDHPVMSFSVHDLGSLVLELDGNRLDGTLLNRSCAFMGDPACELDAFTMVKGTPRAGYIRLSTSRASIATGGALPVRLELENIRSTQELYILGLYLVPPSGGAIPILVQPLVMPQQSEIDITPSLPVSAGLPPGNWKLFALLLTWGVDVIDASLIQFVVL